MSTKKPSAIFLAVILLVTGVIVMFSPFVAYGEEAYQSFKCNGNNINIDNIEQIQQLQTENNNNFDAATNSQQQVTPTGAEEEGEGEEPLNALTGNSNGNGNSEPLLTLKNVCFNFGNNENNALITPEPPEPTKTTLRVTQEIVCQDNTGSPDNLCAQVNGPTGLITEDQFTMRVEGNNAVPSEFPGSEAGTVVTLDPGDYRVFDPIPQSVFDDIVTLNNANPGFTFLFGEVNRNASGDCDVFGQGTIVAGESQTCNFQEPIIIELDR